MRISAKASHWSTSIILALSALTLILAPVKLVQALVYQRGAPSWYLGLIVATVLARVVISYGLFERKSWAWLLYSLDKILFLALYGIRYIQAETLSYAQVERSALVLPTILTLGKLILALVAYKEFTPNFKRHLIELWQNWRKLPAFRDVFAETKSNAIIRWALLAYFALTLGTQTMGQTFTALLMWANSLGIGKFMPTDSYWFILIGGIVTFVTLIASSYKKQTLGWKVLMALFFFTFLAVFAKQIQLPTASGLQFWLRRGETLMSFLWLVIMAFWLSEPQKGRALSWQKRKAAV